MAEVEFQRTDGVLRIHMNRPQKHNALTAEMYLAIADAVAEAAEDPEVGCTLATATADSAVFSSPFTSLGLVPEAASTYLMPLMVGYRRAAALPMAGESWTAADTLDAGLVSHMRPPDEAEATAVGLAKLLAARPRSGMLQTKALLQAGFREATVTQMAREAEAFTAAVRSPEARTAFAAFLKR